MKRPNRKDYINNDTKIQLIADQELYIDHLEKQIKQLRIGGGVVSGLIKKCKDLNLDPEFVLLEYDSKLNGFDMYVDEGIEVTYMVKKGFIQC